MYELEYHTFMSSSQGKKQEKKKKNKKQNHRQIWHLLIAYWLVATASAFAASVIFSNLTLIPLSCPFLPLHLTQFYMDIIQ